MPKIVKVLKKLSDLHEFNRKLKAYKLKRTPNKSLKEDAAKYRRAYPQSAEPQAFGFIHMTTCEKRRQTDEIDRVKSFYATGAPSG